jgi:hypothetical protein
MATVTVEQIAEELRQLPAEKLAVVYDFIGYLRQKIAAAEVPASESTRLAEAGMADYLGGLQDYEDRLAGGEIRWSGKR